jgi:c-di-GMP-binding flagellar brake protein YcgR
MSRGLIYMGGEEQEITVKNLSLTGVLAELKSQHNRSIKEIYDAILASTIIDLYLPDARLSGESEVVRVDMEGDRILLTLEFKNVSYDVDNRRHKRAAYRKNITASGRILLNGEYREFNTVNVSVGGMMISLAEPVAVDEGLVTLFELKLLELKGEVKVVWVTQTVDTGTIVGLKYINMEKEITGIPHFAH